ncbi:hypothetical protein KUV50_09485 [Membranicola marinus]|uniref:Bacterial surface antigen (D15) domain-containing protein n=1 Tax=Membranihabitans marinus TaxID=1227546 RepID=A0A953L751_9BACT|nr:BamA/TamA family outer membrane protein [Membranihabitans marinus]MBY5958362.1 hypothetical protein [Membranihabitans marinus]
MDSKLVNIILFLTIMGAKISYCQQDSMFLSDMNNCPEEITGLDTLLTKQVLLDRLFEKGYPYASIDSSSGAGEITPVYSLDCGPHINFVSIRWTDEKVQELLDKYTRQKVVPWNEVVEQRNKVLTTLANQGYPYTRLMTDPIAIIHDTLQLEYELDTIRRIYIQEIIIKGGFSMNQSLFETMIGMKAGDYFSIDRIERTRQVIRQWDFADLKNLEYDFNPYAVNLNYHIEPSQPSRFDLLIGLVPSNRVDKKYEITGNAYLDIRNQLRMAERIYFRFDKYANTSQSIDLRFDFPYLPFIRSGVLAEGLIDRRDSTVLDVYGKLGVQYRWSPTMKYAVFLQRDQSRLISVNPRRLLTSGQLPEELDYNYSAAGINISHQALDHMINPRKGRVFSVAITAGLKRLVRNGQILALELPTNETSFSAQYDSVSQSTLKTRLDVQWDGYVPVGQYSSLRVGVQAGWIWSSAPLFKNEQLRLGGFQDFRGFPDKSFRADAYSTLTTEYRFLFGEESNAYVFTDFGFLHEPDAPYNWNFPYSFGIGLNLGTKAGIFGISYAVGAQRNQSLSLEQSRVNFGLMVNY